MKCVTKNCNRKTISLREAHVIEAMHLKGTVEYSTQMIYVCKKHYTEYIKMMGY